MIYVMGDGGTDITHYGIQPGGGRKGVVVGYDDISGPGQGIYMPAGQILPAAVQQPSSMEVKDTGFCICILF